MLINRAMSRLQPIAIRDLTTNETVQIADFYNKTLTPLIDWITKECERIYDEDTDFVKQLAGSIKGSVNSWSRANGIKPGHMTLPREIKAKSRIGMIIHGKLMTETASFVNGQLKGNKVNPNKVRDFRFAKTLNLGFADSQMVKITKQNNLLFLEWLCWDKHLELTFIIPNYYLQNNETIKKITLPVVSTKGFIFTIQQDVTLKTGTKTAGVDLGKKHPFTMATSHDIETGKHEGNQRLYELNQKRLRIIEEVKHITKKIKSYKTLGINPEKLYTELYLKRRKARQIGKEVAKMIANQIINHAIRENIDILHIENLKWVKGNKYGGRWNHGETGNQIEHAAHKNSIRIRRINPANTSNNCHKCGTKVKHQTKKRTVTCEPCQTTMDRDWNAALNIKQDMNKKLNKNVPVNENRTNRAVCSTNAGLVEKTTQQNLKTLKTLQKFVLLEN